MHPRERFRKRATKYELMGEAMLWMTLASFFCRLVYVPQVSRC